MNGQAVELAVILVGVGIGYVLAQRKRRDDKFEFMQSIAQELVEQGGLADERVAKEYARRAHEMYKAIEEQAKT